MMRNCARCSYCRSLANTDEEGYSEEMRYCAYMDCAVDPFDEPICDF